MAAICKLKYLFTDSTFIWSLMCSRFWNQVHKIPMWTRSRLCLHGSQNNAPPPPRCPNLRSLWICYITQQRGLYTCDWIKGLESGRQALIPRGQGGTPIAQEKSTGMGVGKESGKRTFVALTWKWHISDLSCEYYIVATENWEESSLEIQIRLHKAN